MSEIVALAYSGGLDTSVAIRWLKEKYGMDVIAITVDVGNERDFSVIKQKALNAGADSYFEKPFSPLELVNKVEEIVGL